jgi:hypothetical protein
MQAAFLAACAVEVPAFALRIFRGQPANLDVLD